MIVWFDNDTIKKSVKNYFTRARVGSGQIMTSQLDA